MLNSILICGDSLYSIISQSINKSYLLLTDVPGFVDVDNHVYNLQYSNSFSGAQHMAENSLPHVTLKHAFNEIFVSLHYNICLLTIGMNTVAISLTPDLLYLSESYLLYIVVTDASQKPSKFVLKK